METLIETKPKLAFTGVGWIGRNRMEAAAASGLAEISLICDPSVQCIEEANKIVPGCRTSDSFEETIREAGIDGVVIATPNAYHMQQSIDAFAEGKAVFCQKPLGRNLEEVQAVVYAAKKADKLLGADFSYRYTTAFRKILNVVRSGELGKIFAADLKFHNAYGPGKSWFYDIHQSGGGCVLDLGIHLVDMLLYTMDFPEVVKVQSSLYAKGVPVKGQEQVEDYANISMELDNEVTAQLSCSWNLNAGQDATIEAIFYGTNGTVAFKNVNGSYYDFIAHKYYGTQTIVLAEPPDAWGGRALVDWISRLSLNNTYNFESEQFLKSAEVLDRIYGRI